MYCKKQKNGYTTPKSFVIIDDSIKEMHTQIFQTDKFGTLLSDWERGRAAVTKEAGVTECTAHIYRGI